MLEMKGGFIKNLPKVYGLYTGGFAIFIIIMAIIIMNIAKPPV